MGDKDKKESKGIPILDDEKIYEICIKVFRRTTYRREIREHIKKSFTYCFLCICALMILQLITKTEMTKTLILIDIFSNVFIWIIIFIVLCIRTFINLEYFLKMMGDKDNMEKFLDTHSSRNSNFNRDDDK